MSTVPSPSSAPVFGEPVWDLAHLYPNQGCWNEREYLDLATNRRVEFTDGYLEVLAMPTTTHHLILLYFFDLLRNFATAGDLGRVMFAGVRVQIRPGKFREPDIIFIAKEHYQRIGNLFWTGADLVVEVVSPDDESQHRDYESKVKDYAEGGIPEYWIVDPQLEKIVVLTLDGDRYRTHGEFFRGQQATSVLLPDFSADVSAVIDSGKLPT